MKAEVYQQVTNRIVAMLEAGTKPWQKSWQAGAPIVITGAMQRPLRSNGQAYRGMNVLNLWVAAQMRGLQSRHWMTYKGASELGGQVRKGAKAELAFYVGQSTKAGENEGDEDRTFNFLKCYHVFNADEIDGLPPRFAPVAAPVEQPAAPVCPHARNAVVDAFFADAGVKLSHGGNRAFYMPSTDAVRMPELAQFNSGESYYATLAHEAVHWTGHESRCAREFGKRFGDDAYAVEELVAELGAAFLCADLEISDAPREDHASYLASWLKVLKADSKAIFTAASAADRAASFLHAAQPSVAEALAA